MVLVLLLRGLLRKQHKLLSMVWCKILKFSNRILSSMIGILEIRLIWARSIAQFLITIWSIWLEKIKILLIRFRRLLKKYFPIILRLSFYNSLVVINHAKRCHDNEELYWYNKGSNWSYCGCWWWHFQSWACIINSWWFRSSILFHNH